METRSINNHGYELKKVLDGISTKSAMKRLNITNISISTFYTFFLEQFRNLVHLNLSHCSIRIFENGVFGHLVSLESINLSNNMIRYLDGWLFETNTNLKVVNFNHNQLEWVNRMAFLMLTRLEVLDLSYNSITVLNEYCLCCENLKELYVNHNAIESIFCTTFDQVPNLTRLTLQNNRLTILEEELFMFTNKLQYLNLNSNRLRKLSPLIFRELQQLKILHLRNNLIKQSIDNYWFLNMENLTDLDMSSSDIFSVNHKAFKFCQNLKCLNLTVLHKFSAKSIRSLTYLTKFELVYKRDLNVAVRHYFWEQFKNKNQLVALKLILHHLDDFYLCKLSHLTNLEYLHIECLKPNESLSGKFEFLFKFNRMVKLQTVILIRLNYFTIEGSRLERGIFDNKNLNYLDFTGLKNNEVNDFYQNFRNLQYLNLSFSEIEIICDDAFKYSFNLKYLNMEHSKLRSINSLIFKYTTKLEKINLSSCHIEFVEDFSFNTLSELNLLDLRDNRTILLTKNTFSGLKSDTVVLLNLKIDLLL